jgi:hypothetical protein
MFIIGYEQHSIILPSPLFGDEHNNQVSVQPKYSMNGTRYTTIKSSLRRRHKYSFDLSYAKAREFIDFLWGYSEEVLWINEGQPVIIVNAPTEVTYGIHNQMTIELEDLI